MKGAALVGLLGCALVSGCSHLDIDTFFSDVKDILWRTPNAGDPVHGRQIAELRCAGCHALRAGSAGYGGPASFPELATRSALTISRLTEILSRLPHPMPAIVLPEPDVRDLVAYIHSSGVLGD